MTKLLQEALEAVQRLPEEDQDAIATLILEELAEERRWDEAFANSQEELSFLAAKAREERKAGRTVQKGFGEI